MIGKLFSSAASSLAPSPRNSPAPSRPPSIFDSGQEERHTLQLLFPGRKSLQQQYSNNGENSSTHGYDDFGGVATAINPKTDIRVLIAQDRGQHQAKNVIFDTNPPTPPNVAPLPSPINLPMHKSRGSIASLSETPTSIFGGGLGSFGTQRSRYRNSVQIGGTIGSIESSPSTPGAGPSSISGAPSRSEEEMRILMDCMFGTTAMSFKGSSTKVHVLPPRVGIPDSKISNQHSTVPDSPANNGETGGRRSTASSQAYSSPISASKTAELNTTQISDGTNVLVTRMFSIMYPSGASRENPLTPTELPGQSYPFPKMNTAPSGARLTKPYRACTFAIGIVIRLPNAPKRRRTTSSHHREASISVRPEMDAPSSLGSESFLADPIFGLDRGNFSESPFDDNDRVDYISEHWDIISRCMFTLQKQVQDQMRDLLKHLDASPTAGNARRNMDIAVGALSSDRTLKEAVNRVRIRIATGFRIPKVLTGQARWDNWVEEARWVTQWSGGKEHNFFFLVLLNAFLGHQSDWLDALGPDWYRKKHSKQTLLANKDEDHSIPTRTVIIGNDRTALRRLVFLLSFFLPAGNVPASERQFLKDDRPFSLPGSARLTKSSLKRRQSNRSTILRPHPDGHGHVNLIAWNLDNASDRPRKDPSSPKNSTNVDSTSREVLLRSANLPIPVAKDSNAHKSSSATTATLTPVTGSAYLSPGGGIATGTGPGPRPESSGSLASINLMHQLRRTDQVAQSPNSNESSLPNRWSGIFNVFRNRPRTNSEDGSEAAVYPPKLSHNRHSSALDGSLEELEYAEVDNHDFAEQPAGQNKTDFNEPLTPLTFTKPINSQSKPLSISVDSNDGVVDVDVSLPSLLNLSLGSSLPSWPSSSATTWLTDELTSTSTADSGLACTISDIDMSNAIATDTNINVASYLPKFHPDFLVQAVEPYDELDGDIRRALFAEVPWRSNPTTVAGSPGASTTPAQASLQAFEKTGDISSILIADTRDFRVHRLRLRKRRNRGTSTPVTNPGPKQNDARAGSSLLDHSDYVLVDEKIMDLDAVLSDAIEKVLTSPKLPINRSLRGTGPSNGSTSAMSSRENSKRGNDTTASSIVLGNMAHQLSEAMGAGSLPANSSPASPMVASLANVKPRDQARQTIVGALEEIVRLVTTDREGGTSTETEDNASGSNSMNANATTHAGISSLNNSFSSKSVGGGLGRLFRRSTSATESTLREGIRRWMEMIEDGR
jgi:hypothetical protein